MKSLFKNILNVAFASFSLAAINPVVATEQVDVLFLYSQAVADHYAGATSTRINHLIETTNSIYDSSKLDIEINAVEVQQYDINDETDPYTLMADSKNSAEIAELRDGLGADLVVIYRMYKAGEPCGLAYRPTSFDSTWVGMSFVAIDCASYKTAHEIGHNMGLGHSYAQGSEPLLNYGRGHGVEGKFATVMAYGSAYNAPKVYRFSSPDYQCNDSDCGVAEGTAQEANAVKALQQTSPLVANLRQAKNIQQCDAQQATTFSQVETAYQTQQSDVLTMQQQLDSLQDTYTANQATYQQVLAAYSDLIVNDYYPTITAYQTLKTTFNEQLIAYRQGDVNRDAVITAYSQYKTAREQYIAAQEQITTFHATEYLIAYKAMHESSTALANLQNNVQTEQTLLAQLETEYNEAKAIYRCA